MLCTDSLQTKPNAANAGDVRRSTATDWKRRYHNLNISSHNYLRITRILKFLGYDST